MKVVDTLKRFISNLLQTKPIPNNPLASDLVRCLGLIDLTYLSIGAMIGVGVYVTMGEISRETGPSIIISYILGGLASVLSALCYAELASRIPIAGSSYQFTYMTMGEFWGFFVGWNIALEHAIGSAAISRAVSGYIDSLMGNVIRNYLVAHTPLPGGMIATYPDFFAAGYIIVIVTLIALGIKFSSRTNIFFVTLNFIICGFIIVSAVILGNVKNLVDVDHGGFFPNGFSSTLTGAATLIFAYIGYEVIGAAAEEASNPRRNIPLSLIISIAVVMLIYTSVAFSFVAIVPWYKASTNAPFVDVYKSRGWFWANYLITIGIIVASSAANIAATVAIPRYIFSMARDGLLMDCFAEINPYTEVPVYATIFGGTWCVLLTLLFSLKQLIDFMSIGQLVACIFVAMIVIKLRYQPFDESSGIEKVFIKREEEIAQAVVQTSRRSEPHDANESTKLLESGKEHTGTLRNSVRHSKLGPYLRWTDSFNPGNIPVVLMFTGSAAWTAMLAMVFFATDYIARWWFIILLVLFGIIIISSLVFMMLFVRDSTIETYKIPFAPLSPFLSIIINATLMLKLPVETWIRLGVWIALGLIVYFGYGYFHSKTRKYYKELAKLKAQQHPMDTVVTTNADLTNGVKRRRKFCIEYSELEGYGIDI